MFRNILVACGLILSASSVSTAQAVDWFTQTQPLVRIGPRRAENTFVELDKNDATPQSPAPGEEPDEVEPEIEAFLPFPDPCTGSEFHAYAPPEVADPHPAQILTVFLPVKDPAPSDRFPVLLHSPASAFGQGLYPACFGQQAGTPCASSPSAGLLYRALRCGWAVVTVGTVGHNSYPTCSQDEECTAPGTGFGEDPMCTPTAGCWDPNLFYADDTAEWLDYNYFYGEKDFSWARQYIAHKADELFLDNDRVVATGTSTGALYASFIAFGPDRSRTCTVAPSCLLGTGCQIEQDTRVAGVMAFEPVVWLQAGASVASEPFLTGLSGAHWPKCFDPPTTCDDVGTPTVDEFKVGIFGDGTIEDVCPEFLIGSSISRWVRDSQPMIPVFIASGDGQTTGFARNANVAPFMLDYDRNGVTDDPELDFDELQGTPLFLHDSWHALNFKRDLIDFVDATYHNEHSRLYLRQDTNWAFIPDSLSSVIGPPSGPEEVPLVDGEYGCNCDGSTPDSCGETAPPACVSILNEELALIALNWLGKEFCDGVTASVATRNGGTNPMSYTIPPPVLGTTVTASVDLTTTGHDEALVIGFDSSFDFELNGGQTLLCFPVLGEGDLILTAFEAGPMASIDIEIPGTPCLLGKAIYTQALHAFGEIPFALSNAQDLVLGCE